MAPYYSKPHARTVLKTIMQHGALGLLGLGLRLVNNATKEISLTSTIKSSFLKEIPDLVHPFEWYLDPANTKEMEKLLGNKVTIPIPVLSQSFTIS